MKKGANILFLCFLVILIVVMSFQQPQRFLAVYLSVLLGALIWAYMAFFHKRNGHRGRV